MPNEEDAVEGGYGDGYRAVPRFWPPRPGRLVTWLANYIDLDGLTVLDLGCGEGTNAAWIAAHGAKVKAVELCSTALDHARRDYPHSSVDWELGSAVDLDMPHRSCDVVIAYGLMHCLSDRDTTDLVRRMQHWTRPGGFNLVVTFNDRSQDIADAHPNFEPSLRPHSYYADIYESWDILLNTDEDLTEIHPNNNIEHTHSMTRLAARKRA